VRPPRIICLQPGERAPGGSIIRTTPQQQRFVRSHPPDLPQPDVSMSGEQSTVSRSEGAPGPGVLDNRSKILVLTHDAVRSPERATHPPDLVGRAGTHSCAEADRQCSERA
jgi:hypothetical protein